MTKERQAGELATIAPESLETTTGGLSAGLAQRAGDIAAERHIDALNAGNPLADKFARQMKRFQSYGK
ncbi:MAG TPA: hypothetical protein VIV11_06060 [Kofleriaceae bacterium]